jgi:hypothetical protein
MRGTIERELGMTGNKGLTDAGPVRPQDDPLDKRFLYEHLDTLTPGAGASHASTISSNKGFRDAEHDTTPYRPDVDMNAKYENVGMRDEMMKKTTSEAVDKTAWRFSYDLKKLFDVSTPKNRDIALSTDQDIRGAVVDMKPNNPVQRIPVTTASNDRKAVVPEKKILFSEKERNDFKTNTAHSKRKDADFQPQTKNASAFRGVSVFKTETTTDNKRLNTSTINTDKKILTQLAAPTGTNLSGRTTQIKKSAVTVKRSAQSDGLLYDNDRLLEQAGVLTEPYSWRGTVYGPGCGGHAGRHVKPRATPAAPDRARQRGPTAADERPSHAILRSRHGWAEPRWHGHDKPLEWAGHGTQTLIKP